MTNIELIIKQKELQAQTNILYQMLGSFKGATVEDFKEHLRNNVSVINKDIEKTKNKLSKNFEL